MHKPHCIWNQIKNAIRQNQWYLLITNLDVNTGLGLFKGRLDRLIARVGRILGSIMMVSRHWKQAFSFQTVGIEKPSNCREAHGESISGIANKAKIKGKIRSADE